MHIFFLFLYIYPLEKLLQYLPKKSRVLEIVDKTKFSIFCVVQLLFLNDNSN